MTFRRARGNRRRVINLAGTMTGLGSSSVPEEIVSAVADVLPLFVYEHELQQEASQAIASVVGSEAGCATTCAASGIAVSVAACMTGVSLAKAERLPDVASMKSEVIIQRGHIVHYGGSIRQAIRITGARLVEIGDSNRAGTYQLREAISDDTAAAVFVVSHHVVQHGQIALSAFCHSCHEQGIPVIVDAASESAMSSFIEQGADLACFSVHKFLSGPTAGIIAGRRDLIQACLVNQLGGIGRMMKVGKEGTAGTIAALDRWACLDHAAQRRSWERNLTILEEALQDLDGVGLLRVADLTGNPIQRLRVQLAPAGGPRWAQSIITELASRDPSIAVREHQAIDHNRFELDPCNATLDETREAAEVLRTLLARKPSGMSATSAGSAYTPNRADIQAQQLVGRGGDSSVA